MDEIYEAFGDKLRDHFKRYDRQIDKVSDLTRICRIPGTLNHKGAEQKPVVLIASDLERRYNFDTVAEFVKDVMAKPQPVRNIKEDKKYPPADHESIVKECEWYRRRVVEGAETCEEPDWHKAASITVRCANGEQIFHDYSARHPDYTEQDASHKLNRALTQTGPLTCEEIRKGGNEQYCDACPHYGKISSPIQLGHRKWRQGYDPGTEGPIALGHEGPNYIFKNQQTNQIVWKNADNLTKKSGLLDMAPMSFWEEQFPRIGQRGGVVSGFNLDAAADALMCAARDKGYLPSSLVRGFGGWKENDQLVLNVAKEVPTSLSGFLYTAVPRPISLKKERVPVDLILEFLSKPNWALRKSSPTLIFGWAVSSIICGALPWRPHMGITGGSSVGKTTLLDGISNITTPFSLKLDGCSSEAGLRQHIGLDAIPVILDEFETESHSDLGRTQKILKTIRSSSSATNLIARGTPSGKALSYQPRSMFMLGAINLVRISAADANRMVCLEMKPPENASKSRAEILELREKLENVGPAFCQHALDHAQEILDSVPVLHRMIPTMQMKQADNVAVLLAGAWVGQHSGAITAAEAEKFVAGHLEAIEEHGQQANVNDGDECLNSLMGFMVRTEYGEHSIGYLLGVLRGGKTNMRSTYAQILRNHGVGLEEDGIYIATTHPGISRVYAGTRWQGGAHTTALRRLPGACPGPQKSLDNSRTLTTQLPLIYVQQIDEPVFTRTF